MTSLSAQRLQRRSLISSSLLQTPRSGVRFCSKGPLLEKRASSLESRSTVNNCCNERIAVDRLVIWAKFFALFRHGRANGQSDPRRRRASTCSSIEVRHDFGEEVVSLAAG